MEVSFTRGEKIARIIGYACLAIGFTCIFLAFPFGANLLIGAFSGLCIGSMLLMGTHGQALDRYNQSRKCNCAGWGDFHNETCPKRNRP